jgi:hypothetical protein
MSLENFEYPEHAIKMPNRVVTQPDPPARRLASHLGLCARLSLCLPILLMFGCKVHPTPPEEDDKYRAFYYNAVGELLEVEIVSEAEASRRVLEDIAATKIAYPQLTMTAFPKTSGTNKVISKDATVAVYYTYVGYRPANGTPNVQAIPVKVEDLQLVKQRTLTTCVARASTDPCTYPRRCHCVGPSCCCY